MFTKLGKFKKIGGMMRHSISVYMVALILVFSTAVGLQAAEIKIGMIDFQAVVGKSEPG